MGIGGGGGGFCFFRPAIQIVIRKHYILLVVVQQVIDIGTNSQLSCASFLFQIIILNLIKELLSYDM